MDKHKHMDRDVVMQLQWWTHQFSPFCSYLHYTPKLTINFAAEVVAISSVLEWIWIHQNRDDLKTTSLQHNISPVHRWYLNSTQWGIHNFKSTIAGYLLACIHMTTSSKFPIQLKYIPAHKGNIWNEITDSLAKEQRDNFDTLENNDSISDQTQQNKKTSKLIHKQQPYRNGTLL